MPRLDTVAGNPGGVRISLVRLIWRNPFEHVFLFSVVLGSAALAVCVHWGFWVLTALAVVFTGLYWRAMRHHFMRGDANPGVVIETEPILIAVRTDLSKGFGTYPVIKVIEEKPSGRWPTPLRVGQVVATVAMYTYSDDTYAHWADFDPLPAGPVAADPDDTKRVMRSFSDRSIEQVREGLAQLGPRGPGLYRVDLDASDWDTDEHEMEVKS